MNQINIRIDREIKDWLDDQPRKVNLSKMVREFLHSVIDAEKLSDTNDRTLQGRNSGN